jgi:transposase
MFSSVEKQRKEKTARTPRLASKEAAAMANAARLEQLSPGTRVFLGIDLSLTSWHVTARCGGETVFSANLPPSRQALATLLKRLKGRSICSVYEAGPFGYGLHDWLTEQGVASMIVSPALVPVEVGNHVKTDRRDSLKLATTLEAGLLRPIYIPDAGHRADRELVRQRARFQKHRRSEMVRLKAFFLLYGIDIPAAVRRHWKGPFHAWLRRLTLEDPTLQKVLEQSRSLYFDITERIQALDVELSQLARSQAYAASIALFSSVPGIAQHTALLLAVEVMDWNRFTTGEAFSSYVGLTPSEYSSGDKIRHGHITRAGNAFIRSALVEASWVLIRRDAQMRLFYDNVKTRRGSKRAIVAVARKLCHRIVAMARTGEMYRLAQPGGRIEHEQL